MSLRALALAAGVVLAGRSAAPAHASEDEVQALIRDDLSHLSPSEASSDAAPLDARGEPASGEAGDRVEGTTVYIAVEVAQNPMLAPEGEYALGEERVMPVGGKGQLLNGNLEPVGKPDNIRSLRKRPVRAKARWARCGSPPVPSTS